MTANVLEKVFEHNNWANQQIIQACLALSDEQLDAEPQSATQGGIRSTLLHLVEAQQGYLRLLTLPLDERLAPIKVDFADLEQSAAASGEALLALAQDPSRTLQVAPIQTRDGYFVEPWVLMVQIINHATEHREQIKSMLTALGITPPEIAGWEFGEATGALIPVPCGW
jgi:uncharacterized damage-inducible protein DinB